jgi:hypothetical protein
MILPVMREAQPPYFQWFAVVCMVSLHTSGGAADLTRLALKCSALYRLTNKSACSIPLRVSSTVSTLVLSFE